MYLKSFTLPTDSEETILEIKAAQNAVKYGYVDNPYPCGLFSRSGLKKIEFGKITIFYGGNGSGKSTLLNLISSKLELKRVSPFNSSETFDLYAKYCKYKTGYDDEGVRFRIPNGSRIITSDDVFDYMLAIRTNNEDITENKKDAREKWRMLKFGDTIKFSGMEDYEALRMQVLARSKSVSRRQFIRRTAGQEAMLQSNGETALDYFDRKLKNDTLYCLDEPENSMSPKMQLELVKILEEMTYYCGCQFIIATHSPFLLALDGAKVYDLDARPVQIQDWWELENVKIYHDFFQKHRRLFE